jgi:hypothetical protein
MNEDAPREVIDTTNEDIEKIKLRIDELKADVSLSIEVMMLMAKKIHALEKEYTKSHPYEESSNVPH